MLELNTNELISHNVNSELHAGKINAVRGRRRRPMQRLRAHSKLNRFFVLVVPLPRGDACVNDLHIASRQDSDGRKTNLMAHLQFFKKKEQGITKDVISHKM